MRNKIGTKIIGGYFVFVIFILAFIGVRHWILTSAAARVEKLSAETKELRLEMEVENLLWKQAAAMSDFLVEGKEADSQQFDNFKKQFVQHLDNLEPLFVGRVEEREKLADLRFQYNLFNENFAKAAKLRREGRQSEAIRIELEEIAPFERNVESAIEQIVERQKARIENAFDSTRETRRYVGVFQFLSTTIENSEKIYSQSRTLQNLTEVESIFHKQNIAANKLFLYDKKEYITEFRHLEQSLTEKLEWEKSFADSGQKTKRLKMLEVSYLKFDEVFDKTAMLYMSGNRATALQLKTDAFNPAHWGVQRDIEQLTELEKNDMSASLAELRLIETTFAVTKNMAFYILVVILIALIIGVVIVLRTTHPIGQLVKATQKLADGDFTARAEIAERGEIGDLAASFNRMAENLQKTTVSKDDLEAKVAERTAELKQVNKILQGEIAERRQAEEKLRRSEASYRQLADSMPQIVWTAQADGYLDYYNQRWFDYTGMTLEQTKGNGWEPVLHPDDLQNCINVWGEALKTGEKYKIQYRFKRASDGEYRWHLGQALPVRDAENQIVKWFGSCTDIHEQKKVEEELRKIQEDLEGRVQVRTLDLEKANFDLKDEITERKRAERELIESQQLLKLVIDTLPQAVWWKDSDLKYLGCNRTMAEEAGFESPEKMIGLSDYDMPWSDKAGEVYRECDRRIMKSGIAKLNVVEQHLQSDGRLAWHKTNKSPLRNADGEIVGILGTFDDITEQKRADAALRESEYKFRTLLESMSEGLLQVDSRDCIRFVNTRFCEMVGYSPDELMGTNWSRLMYNDDGKSSVKRINERRSEGISDSYELCLKKKSGEMLWVIVGGAPILDAEGAITGSMGVFSDITERKRAEERLIHDAFHDALTGLANRTLFIEHLQMTIERTRRDPGGLFAVLFLDFDRFKVINDSLGHAEGDNLLKQIARRLEDSLRTSDLVARLGGDEFTILLNGIKDTSVALRVVKRIQKNLQAPFELSGGEIFISASIGIAFSTTGHKRAEDMLRDADIAMYRAKAKGRAKHQVFDQAMHEQALAQLRIETELRQAIEQRDFCLHYQPIINLKTNLTVGFESLVRWRHSDFGIIPPNDFIPVAEENGLIIPLGKWILHESCRQLREWQVAKPSASEMTVSVNLSFKQFLQVDLVEQVAETLEKTGLNPRYLKLEITESHIMENTETAVKTMRNLRALGVQLSLDDFGTGYSSLSHLHRLPVSYLKIDHSFINRMIESQENSEIVRTIVRLAQNLKMRVVAEGIETDEQLTQLKILNCEYGQGYLFAKPMDTEAAEIFLDRILENPPRQLIVHQHRVM